ncbi:MAG: hypothetical protein ABJZ55_13205 [Fuerstiella sp.]
MSDFEEESEHPQHADQRVQSVRDFLAFVLGAKIQIAEYLVSASDSGVRHIQEIAEEHSVDDNGHSSMYQRLESAFYDDAQQQVTLWNYFDRYNIDQLNAFQRMLKSDHEGLTGDRSPRKIFDRSPFGIIALVVGTVTIWLGVLQKYAGDDLNDMLTLFHYNSFAGLLWIVGLFVVLWYILKTVRNNRQVSLLMTISRALEVYLAEKWATADGSS